MGSERVSRPEQVLLSKVVQSGAATVCVKEVSAKVTNHLYITVFSHEFAISELLRASQKVRISNSTWYLTWQVHQRNMDSVAGATTKYAPGAITIIQMEYQNIVAKSWLN